MKTLFTFLGLLVYHLSYSQCTPALVLASTSINTPNYPINTAFNANSTAPATINNLSSGLITFSASVSGSATWSGGVQIQNDGTVGDYIFLQPTNAPNAASNPVTYTIQFSEPVYNFSFRTAGLNNSDRVVITAFNNATPINIADIVFSDIVDDPGNGGTISITGNTLVGNNTAGGVSVNTNRFTTTINVPVTQIVIRSGKANTSTSTVTIGLTSITYNKCVTVPPDLNATFVNVPITGNVGTNDIQPAGTQYGTATALPGNPGGAIPAINPDGTYSFTSSVAGVFRFTVPMCPPSVFVPNCPDVPLVITVTEPTLFTNDPFANIDRATTPVNTPVTLNTLANDRSGNNSPGGLNPASVSVTTAPLHGTTSVDPVTGNITYTPDPGYTGFDTLTYEVCDQVTPIPNCVTSQQIITIEDAGAANSTVATDDFNTTPLNTPVSASVITNDSDPQGNTQTVTPQTTSIPGVGTLMLDAGGNYTFTPAPGFSGAVNFPYEICDNGAPVVCTDATLYILVYSSFTLPLNLLSFDASTINANTRLVWRTDNQANADHFEIERSDINPVSFSVVGTVQVNNSASGMYTFTDLNAKAYINRGYYRLKIADRDGRFTYSRIVLINFGKDIAVNIRPGIVTAGEPVYILTSSSAGNYAYSALLYNETGQLIQSWSAVSGTTKQIDTQHLPKGMYVLKVIHGKEVTTQKIVIQ